MTTRTHSRRAAGDDTQFRLEPAWSVLSKLGGPTAVARKLGIKHASTVWKWCYPKAREGRDGYIPHEWYEPLLALARRESVPLTKREFVETPEEIEKSAA